MLQLDIVNAFVHADFNKIIFIKMLSGHAEQKKLLKLNKTFYRLQWSLLL